MMKKPESHDPRKTAKVASQCAFGDIRFSPNTSRPRKLDSRQKQPQKRRFQEEREHPFHAEGLADHAAREAGEHRPVRAKLKFHRNSSDHADHKVDSEDSRPESRGLAIDLVIPPER